MTGVFIPGISMPEHCGRCPLAILTHYGERECFINELNVDIYTEGRMGRHHSCPMEEKEIEEESD